MESIVTPAGGPSVGLTAGPFPSPQRIALVRRDEAVPGENAASFTHLLIPDFFRTAGEAGVVSGQERDADQGSIALLKTARDRGLPPLVDVVLDRVASGGSAASQQAGLFRTPAPGEALDPRRGFSTAFAKLSIEDDGTGAGAWWGQLLAQLGREGLAGARLLGLHDIPPHALRGFVGALRASAPGMLLIADTCGLPWERFDSLAGLGVDAVQCSLRWWNFQDTWFPDELARLRDIAPVIAPLPDLPSDGTGRAVGYAAIVGLGWIAPPGALPSETLALAVASSAKLGGSSRSLSAPGAAVLVQLTSSAADPRWSHDATLSLLNTSLDRVASVDPSAFLPDVGGAFSLFAPLHLVEGGEISGPLVPGETVTLRPGEVRSWSATLLRDGTPLPLDAASAERAATEWTRLALEAPEPAVDGGRFAVKRTIGEVVDVEIDIIGDGHDKLTAVLQWQPPGDVSGEEMPWHETRMRPLGNDRWTARFPLSGRGLHRYRVQAWRDVWGTYRHELSAKFQAGVPTSLEIVEGTNLVRAAAERGGPASGELSLLLSSLDGADEDGKRSLLLSDDTSKLMEAADARPFSVFSDEIPVDAERTAAGFASWYEVFPRSMSDDTSRHGTFRDVEKHLPRVKAMGFDVLYFTPIHPIGKTNRKGPNNTLTPGPEDVGSPYAVGTADGGHDALHPALGTLEDFLHLRQAAAEHGLELALDFAIQCSPDHPWLRDHKDWFDWRPDGSIRYAENPPKKYQDIVNVDFYATGAIPGLWVELANVVLFWCRNGIRLFRVDNPHTKPLPFWQWMIAEVRARYPDAVFLAEAFTRPKVMNRLAKVGFGQSYTYFTWRNTKAELTEYLTQLTQEPPKDFFRPHFFVNTPDINPSFLQNTTRGAFLIRAAAAATLSGLWGVYSGFELCEGTPLAPGKEEYLDSEKFQLKAWDWDRPGNIVPEVSRLNKVRRENPALHTHRGISFLPAANDAVLFFEKATRDRSNVVIVAISMDPRNAQQAAIELPLYRWSLPDSGTLEVEDLMSGDRFRLSGKYQSIQLTPERPFLIWRATPAA
ncbi:alpha-1,4-glucan--maltose-1-phosphate maltosyltransferase [Rhizosaccharibacter radicis]|uniref:Alpha-1,4-glucan:maltose-1-phosphate maltosyltransferase n=1 Tax=Rhizosaccharibacter radicis TaxID=2782605 RepID=A0ABT1VZ18_9PROT|nr:alpha-1,4-glucan--maltose-1-phosphate maltosyltransferase [Acetobacteraceae bacterium KSS12]